VDGTVLWSASLLFFWCLFVWMVIAAFGDIFRRTDLSGGAKAGWTALVVLVPLVGVLIYLVARPRMTAQDRQITDREYQRRAATLSAAERIDKLAMLREEGRISPAEYDSLKRNVTRSGP
jgi:predicted membrane channel-forming protein YqfA (hemolysin III family)